MRLTACSLILLCACANIPRPDTDMCVLNAPGKHAKCYNLQRDYDDNGKLKPGAKATFKPFTAPFDVNKWIATDPDGFANLKAYINKLKDEYARRCQP